MNRLLIVLSIIFGVFLSDQISADMFPPAICNIEAGSGIGNVSGKITFHHMESNKVTVHAILTGFPVTTSPSLHGFHAHQSGNLSMKCNACLGHFNPYNAIHGDINDPHDKRHVGDLGNILVQPNGTVDMTIIDDFISLNSSSTNYIVGKGMVVHEKEDDLGRGGDVTSNTTGNAGGRLGCCTIVLDQHSGECKR